MLYNTVIRAIYHGYLVVFGCVARNATYQLLSTSTSPSSITRVYQITNEHLRQYGMQEWKQSETVSIISDSNVEVVNEYRWPQCEASHTLTLCRGRAGQVIRTGSNWTVKHEASGVHSAFMKRALSREEEQIFLEFVADQQARTD